jgi:GNAT superfamily N-acetyltransferase
MTGPVRTRDVVQPDDAAFLLALYDTTRRSELSGLGWPDAQLDTFIGMQFDAQNRHYAMLFPEADNLIVLVGDEPAGRLIVDRPEGEIRIVDIALLPRHRGVGVGGELIRQLCAEADRQQLPLRCHVVIDNDARRFWEHLAFEERGIDGVHVAMERPCRSAPD